MAAVALGLVVGGAAPASAHNAMIGSDPADGATVSPGLAEIRLFFLLPLEVMETATVTGPDGEPVPVGDPEMSVNTVTIPLMEEAIQPGEYELVFDSVATDGHPLEGQVRFTVGDGEGQSKPSTLTPGPAGPLTPSSSAPPPTAAAAPSPSDLEQPDLATGERPTDGGVGWWWPLFAVLVVGGAGVGGYLFWRRRSTN